MKTATLGVAPRCPSPSPPPFCHFPLAPILWHLCSQPETDSRTGREQLKSDVFSISFLPCGAPGAGNVMICGLRDGSVRLVDSRQSPNLNGEAAAALTAPTAAISATLASSSSGGGGDQSAVTYGNCIELTVRERNRHCFGPRSSKSPPTVGKTLSVGGSSSVDHIHALQDGTRCLVRRRFGDLHVLDLRFAGRPPRVLVEPPAPATLVPVRGRFALDDKETVVATPISSTVVSSTAAARGPYARPSGRAEGGGMEVGAGERFSLTPPAWDTFSRGGGSGSGSKNSNGVVRFAEDLERTCGGKGMRGSGNSVGDRLRILSLTTGEVLSEISTPWTGLSLARGWETGRGGTVAGCCRQSDVKFWGIASGFDKSATVFEASL